VIGPAIAGMGVAILPESLVTDDFAIGNLKRALCQRTGLTIGSRRCRSCIRAVSIRWQKRAHLSNTRLNVRAPFHY
jgi:hypothetical protein